MDHVRVQTHAGHDGETAVIDHSNVDTSPARHGRRGDRVRDVGGHAHVVGEQVPRAERKDGQADGGAGESARAGPHRSVAPGGEDYLRSIADGPPSLATSGIVGCRLQPFRWWPTRPREGGGDGCAFGSQM
jgi:hypothetical protein